MIPIGGQVLTGSVSASPVPSGTPGPARRPRDGTSVPPESPDRLVDDQGGDVDLLDDEWVTQVISPNAHSSAATASAASSFRGGLLTRSRISATGPICSSRAPNLSSHERSTAERCNGGSDASVVNQPTSVRKSAGRDTAARHTNPGGTVSSASFVALTASCSRTDGARPGNRRVNG